MIDDATDLMESLWNATTVYRPDLFKGEVALVPGGGSGIGRATALLFARLGARVYITGRKQEKLDAVIAFAKSKGAEIAGHSGNLREHDNVVELFSRVEDCFGSPDHVVNSAGGHFAQDAIDFSPKGWNTVISNNLDSSWFVMQRAAQRWRDLGRGGSVTNIIVVTERGMPGVAHTVAARAGIIGAMRTVAVEWAPLGIRVNCIAPGLIQTEGHEVYSEDARREFARANPLKKTASPMQIAQAAAYLSADSGDFITGEVLTIDGGGRLWGEFWLSGRPDWFQDHA